jgi:hypothetical protein
LAAALAPVLCGPYAFTRDSVQHGTSLESHPNPLPLRRKGLSQDIIVAIVEPLSTCEDLGIYALADEYGYPIELLKREFATYQCRYQRELRRRAAAAEASPADRACVDSVTL